MLPILQSIVDRVQTTSPFNLAKITFICVQHLLFTTVDIIKSLILLQAKPHNIHIMGKIYSSCPAVVDQLMTIGVNYHPSSYPSQLGHFNDYFNSDIINMWDKISDTIINTNSNTIIVLDDGGKAIANVPKELLQKYKTFVVEQTSSGMSYVTKNNIALPMINVAYSAAKQLLESPMIAKAVITKLIPSLPVHTNKAVCGVVGLGVIGRAVVELLLSLGHRVIVYDKLNAQYDLLNSVQFMADEQLLFQEADYIFGCTGEDITTSIDLTKLQGTKNFISCSSQDIEFCSLLKMIQNSSYKATDVMDNIEYPLNTEYPIRGGIIRILKGGYPINFDNTGESVPAKDIQLTRALLFGGVIQAMLQSLQNPEPKQYMLNPALQKFIVQELINSQSPEERLYNSPLIIHFLNEQWIQNNSSGEYVDNNIITNLCKKPIRSSPLIRQI
ncbi:NAD(P)-dependent oxidoreductase [Candidatus Tisiphia endosymbiont of Nemotelus uliginosus]|uniref:NAD(P)-dependent oxidoreductase n=1 Tax=Candidatus Tisiphia endosymbiont of Nemotelus uliginosus TaxID=3077926 RepID=UPI0035C8E79C